MFRPCLLLAFMVLLSASAPAQAAPESAQLVGTVRDGRARWNPFLACNDLSPVGDGTFTSTLKLSASGGRNGDGVYVMRFFT
ncbi:MAG: hypothetical protein WCH98_23460, partial [Verrucomicrobiota bacterium]